MGVIMIINLLNMDKIYKTKDKNQVVALNKVNISFKKTGLTFILGPSGSGKSTLLNVIGGLDEASSGKVEIDKKELGKAIGGIGGGFGGFGGGSALGVAAATASGFANGFAY